MKILRDPIWQFVGVYLTAAGIFIALAQYDKVWLVVTYYSFMIFLIVILFSLSLDIINKYKTSKHKSQIDILFSKISIIFVTFCLIYTASSRYFRNTNLFMLEERIPIMLSALVSPFPVMKIVPGKMSKLFGYILFIIGLIFLFSEIFLFRFRQF